MSAEQSLNRGWHYVPNFDPSYLNPLLDTKLWQLVELPHTNLELPYNGFDEKSSQFVSTYCRDLGIAEGLPLDRTGVGDSGAAGGSRLFVEFGAVMGSCEVYLDGTFVTSHEGGFTPFSVELTEALGSKSRARLLVKVDSTEQEDLPPFGNVVDYLCYGGIYREVSLRSTAHSYLKDVHARPLKVLESEKSLELRVSIDGPLDGLSIACSVKEGARGMAETRVTVDGPSMTVLMESLVGLRVWDLEDPALYEVDVSLLRGAAELDRRSLRIGFRSAEFRAQGFFLNGAPLPLTGLNRHQSFPYVGYAMPERVQRRDAEIMKRELSLNMVRSSHYPPSVHFLDACDELGLLVFEELPGWQHIGGEAWKERAKGALREMIVRDRSRPSVVLWGTRINESRDDHDFYAATAAIARSLDPDRAIGGVRYLEKSELLEDVYTFNDFSHDGGALVLKKPRQVTGLRKKVPYLVSEHNGHMFPTKRFDQEERQAEHALRHLRVMEASRSIPGIAGAIGWCAFDYNTHKDFGSGDRICYHGVGDMFRIPKVGSFPYASQRPIAQGPYLEAASLFSKGERAAARLLPIYVYTNCDEVVLFRGQVRIGSFTPAWKEFPHLEHPPVIIRDLIGDQLAGERFSSKDVATIKRLTSKVLSGSINSLTLLDLLQMGLLLLRYRLNMAQVQELIGNYAIGWGRKDEVFELVGCIDGQELIRRRYGGDARATRLVMASDDQTLRSGDWDATRVVLSLVDQYGNLCPYVSECVDLVVSGPGRALGPTRVALIGGCIAFWVRSDGSPGTIDVAAEGSRFRAEGLSIRVLQSNDACASSP